MSFGKGRIILFVFYLILLSALMTQKVKSWKGPSSVFPACLIFFFFNFNFIYFWLCWVFVAVQVFLLWRVEDILQFWCAGFSFRWPLLAQSMGSRAQAQ